MPAASVIKPVSRVYAARLAKGGALVNEMRQLLHEWDRSPGRSEAVITSNVLSSPTRSRARAIVNGAFIPRFVRSDPPDLWKSLVALERAGWALQALLPIHYYATAASDSLIWDFVLEVLADRAERGKVDVRIEDVERFLDAASAEKFPSGRWNRNLKHRVAQGVLATLRDFGVLAGVVKKRLTPVYLPTETFAFIAMIRHQLGLLGSAALTDECWRLFFLSDTAVERFFVDAHQRKLLEYHAAGSVVRIEFPAETVEGYARELAQRAN